MMPGPTFVLIRAQQESLAVEDLAWNDADRHSAAILISLEAYDVRGK
jgi:hypothetical protein